MCQVPGASIHSAISVKHTRAVLLNSRPSGPQTGQCFGITLKFKIRSHWHSFQAAVQNEKSSENMTYWLNLRTGVVILLLLLWIVFIHNSNKLYIHNGNSSFTAPLKAGSIDTPFHKAVPTRSTYLHLLVHLAFFLLWLWTSNITGWQPPDLDWP